MIRNKEWKRKACNLRQKKAKLTKKTEIETDRELLVEEIPDDASNNDPQVWKAKKISKKEENVSKIVKRFNT